MMFETCAPTVGPRRDIAACTCAPRALPRARFDIACNLFLAKKLFGGAMLQDILFSPLKHYLYIGAERLISKIIFQKKEAKTAMINLGKIGKTLEKLGLKLEKESKTGGKKKKAKKKRK